MAVAIDILGLDRAKRELSIPANVTDDDALLTEQIGSAVEWCMSQTGHDLAEVTAGTVPAGFKAAVIFTLRRLYDGIATTPANAAVWSLLAPYRGVEFDADADDAVTTLGLPRYIGWNDGSAISIADFINGLSESDTDTLTVPMQPAGLTRLWFARPESAGYPTSVFLEGTGINQVNAFTMQAGTLDVDLTTVVVGVSNQELSHRLAGRRIILS